MKIKILIVLFFILAISLVAKFNRPLMYFGFDESSFKTGDIIFTRGISIKSFIVLLLQKQTNDYSHCGVIEKENGQFYIVHATPTPVDQKKPRVVKESLKDFLSFNEVTIATVFRVLDNKINEKLIKFINTQVKLETEFDNDFDLFNKKFYCTEFVWKALLEDNITIVDTSKINKVIFPSNMIQFKKLKHIYTFHAY